MKCTLTCRIKMTLARMIADNPRISNPTVGMAIIHAGMMKEDVGQPAREIKGCSIVSECLMQSCTAVSPDCIIVCVLLYLSHYNCQDDEVQQVLLVLYVYTRSWNFDAIIATFAGRRQQLLQDTLSICTHACLTCLSHSHAGSRIPIIYLQIHAWKHPQGSFSQLHRE